MQFGNGIEIRTDVHESISGSISFDNPVGPAAYRLAGGESRPLALKRNGETGNQDFVIPIPLSVIVDLI